MRRSTSRRSAAAARTVNAIRSAPPSPPSRSSRRAATRDDDAAVDERVARRGDLELVGARPRASPSARCDLPLERVDRPRVHLAVADRQEPAVRAIERLELRRASRSRRRRSRSRSAKAAACGTARRARPARSAASGSTNGPNGASGFSVARPTSIRFRSFVAGIGPVPFRRSTSQCDGHAALRQPARRRASPSRSGRRRRGR